MRKMDLLKHFKSKEISSLPCTAYVLNSEDIASFLKKLPSLFRDCYVSDEKIDELAKADSSLSKETIIKTYLPDLGNIQSGDFGEIISYHLIKEKDLPLKLDGFYKWRFKIDKNKPTPLADLVLLHIDNDTIPSENDYIISAEVKTRATNQGNDTFSNAVKEALEGVKIDRISRLAKTLVWMKDKSIQHSMLDLRKKLERFINATDAIYGKKFNAVLVIDDQYTDGKMDTSTIIENQDDDTEIIIFCFPNLKNIYEEVYKNINE